jgi:hypothetical protein
MKNGRAKSFGNWLLGATAAIGTLVVLAAGGIYLFFGALPEEEPPSLFFNDPYRKPNPR